MSDTFHILVVDDDHEIRTLLSEYLQKNGYRVTAVGDGNAMRRALEQSRVDFIVLDLMLPGHDGLKLCRDLRSSSSGHSQIPILILTALGEEIDRIVGMEVGADDYLSKPFNPRELLVRIKAILRRSTQSLRDGEITAPGYQFGDWRMDTTARTLTHADGSEVLLSGAEFKLLSVLLTHSPRTLSRTRLMELLHGRELDPFDRSVDVRVSRLRQTLRDDARAPRIIKTVYGEGYVLGVPVEAR